MYTYTYFICKDILELIIYPETFIKIFNIERQIKYLSSYIYLQMLHSNNIIAFYLQFEFNFKFSLFVRILVCNDIIKIVIQAWIMYMQRETKSRHYSVDPYNPNGGPYAVGIAKQTFLLLISPSINTKLLVAACCTINSSTSHTTKAVSY